MTSSKNKPGAWHWDKDVICHNPHRQTHPWEAVVEEATLTKGTGGRRLSSGSNLHREKKC